jgi:transcriptional regulator with XRE-family HTH domain
MLQLYENIKARRKAAKMTQEELARLTGYTDRSSIARIEKGEIDLPQSKIAQFAEALGTTPGHLMGWDAEPEDLGAIAARVLMDPAVLNMMQEYNTLNTADQFMVRSLVSSLAAKNKKD